MVPQCNAEAKALSRTYIPPGAAPLCPGPQPRPPWGHLTAPPPPSANQGTACMRARAPRQTAALTPHTLRAPSAGRLYVPIPEDYDSHDAMRGRAARTTGKRRRRGPAMRAACWVLLFSKRLRQLAPGGRGVAPGLGNRPVPASLRARFPC